MVALATKITGREGITLIHFLIGLRSRLSVAISCCRSTTAINARSGWCEGSSEAVR
jgi:hypothetical protein